jgi:hypothetical protein
MARITFKKKSPYWGHCNNNNKKDNLAETKNEVKFYQQTRQQMRDELATFKQFLILKKRASFNGSRTR